MIYIGFENYDQIKDYNYEEKLKNHKERWKWIKDENGVKTNYKISNHGRVKDTISNTINDFKKQNNRYYRVRLKIGGKSKDYSIHRLVAEYFCEIPKRHKEKGLTYKDLIPNHIDGRKHHNASFNLEWITGKENTKHAWKTGLCDNIRGEKSYLAKMTEKQAIEICELIMKKKTNEEISKEVGVTKKQIQHIRSKECWKHITSRYQFPKLQEAKHYTTPESTIHQICQLLETKKYINVEIAKMCEVKREYVKDIKTHRRRKDISQNYNF